MGRISNLFISLVEAARILGRTPEQVNELCDEGLIRRRSDGFSLSVHKGDVEEVHEANLHDMARPRELVAKVLLLEREVRALRSSLDILMKVNGMLSSSLSELPTEHLILLTETARAKLRQDDWSIEELLTLSEVFLRVSDADIVRLNEAVGAHDSWRVFYELCLRMCWFVREGALPEDKDTETARVLLHRGLRNLRSIGVLFIENAEFLNTSRELLERTMSHDLAEFDTLIKSLKSDEAMGKLSSYAQNT